MGRKEVRVPLAEQGSIGEADVSQLGVAQRGADLVHVPRCRRAVHERKKKPAAALTSVDERLVSLERSRLFTWIVENAVEREVVVERGVVDT